MIIAYFYLKWTEKVFYKYFVKTKKQTIANGMQIL